MIKAARCAASADLRALEAVPHRLPPARRPPRRACAAAPARPSTGSSCARGARRIAADPLRRPDARQRRRGDRRRRARSPSTSPAASRPSPGVKDPASSRPSSSAVQRGTARRHVEVAAAHEQLAVEHRFGPYGGQYVPETLMPALAELERGVGRGARRRRRSAPSSTRCCATTSGARRRSTCAERLGEVGRARDLSSSARTCCHTGAHKINNALGQALLARRMGKRRDHRRDRRRPARRRDGDRLRAARTSSASSTWASEDMRRQAPNVAAHGAARRRGARRSTPARAR